MIEKSVRPVKLSNIRINDEFWGSYIKLVREQVIPYQWEALNDRVEGADKSYCIQNFRRAAGIEEGEFNGFVFQDSDLYKWIEAAAFSLEMQPDSELEEWADSVVDLMEKAQQPDGYLDTYYILKEPDKRFTNLMNNHELYCMGHMVEAAVAYHNATGKDQMLNIARRFVECGMTHIGPERGKIKGYPGHEVLELALIKLYDLTRDTRYKDFAKYLIDQRGQKPLYFEEEIQKNKNDFGWQNSYNKFQYYQAGLPVCEQKVAQGHAVRAVYLYSGMADVAAASDDETLFEACRTLWDNIVNKQMYVTGGIGATSNGEAFTFDYDLPNDTNYAESCASIGLIFFARRMFEISKDARYINVMERVLYNGVISGMSLDGKKFFYVNPLEVDPKACEQDPGKTHIKPERQKWFGCACCPPNIARLLSSIGNYAYEQDRNRLYMNLFVGGEIHTKLKNADLELKVETNYPWDGKISITNNKPADYELAIRIPDWCEAFTLTSSGKSIPYETERGFAVIKKEFDSGETIVLDLVMETKLIAANPRIREDIGKAAVQRGPLVYCIEENDNGPLLQDIYLDPKEKIHVIYEPKLLGGVNVLTTIAKRISVEDWGDELYSTYKEYTYKDQELRMIPYYAWANRGIGEMIVWVKTFMSRGDVI